MGQGTIAPTFFTDAAVKPFNPVPSAPAGPPPQAPGNSPIHAYVAQNKDATPEQVQAQFPAISLEGIKAILPGVKQDLGIKATAAPAALPQPPNPVAQAMAPIVPPPPQKGPQLNAFTAPDAPGYEPMGKPQVFPQAVSNTPPAGMPQPPTSAPTPPGPPASMMPYANTARQATLAGVPGYVPSESAPPGAPVSPMQSGPPPQDGGRGGNSFLDGLKRFAPALAVALLSKNNPSVGASILGGWQQGTDRLAAEKAQQDAVARQTAQQTLENNRQTAQDANTIAQQGREARQTFLDSLDKIDAKSQEQRVRALPDAEAKAMGIDKASFYDKDGKFIPATAADKAMDPNALAKIQSTNLKELHSATKQGQQDAHDGMTQTQFETKYGIPYDTFTPVETQSDATKESLAATAQQKADDAAKLIAPKVLELTSSKNLKDAQTKYYNMTTPERAKVYKETARLVGLNADDRQDLDKAKIIYEQALGNAAGVNAAAHTVSSQASADRASGTGGVTDAVRQHVYSNFIAPVKGFMNSTSPNRVKLDQDGNLMANPAYYTDANGKVDTAKAGEANDALNESVSQNGGQRYFGKQATPTGAPQGKQTPRSMSGKPNQPVPVVPSALGPQIDATATAMQKDGRANQPHYCERVARQTYQQNTNAYNQYWAGTAKATAQNFINAGIAKPYKPGMPVPAGSLLYSTEKMGGGDGHVQVVGNNGNRYDQHGVNKFSPSNFNWYVPPPGGATTAAKSGPPPQKTASTYAPTDMKTLGGITKPVTEWRAEYQQKTGRPAPF